MKSTDSANWILVTGTSSGIGRAATFTLAENGYRVLAAVRKQEDVESLLAEAGTRRVMGAVEPIILDVTDAGQIAAAVEIVRAKIMAGGRLHAIVNNAGAQWAGPIETMPLTEWRSQFDVTFFGPIALTQQLLPQLRASCGRVINVTSVGGIMPGPMIAAYQAAKAAFEAVRSMRIEFSPFGVHVSAIAPGSISTPMLNRSPDQLNRLADALNALAIQAPSSKPIPTFPLRSAEPRDNRRPASVTIPAPMTTPRIPSSGLWDKSDGRAATIGGGLPGRLVEEIVMVVALMIYCAYFLVRTFTTTDSPGRNWDVRAESSRPIFTGTLCTTFVKFPVALSGGRSANCDPLAGAICRTLP
jgi:NAD(P)-dependent dehydrogenase (short-subunit alcohol dehydrogenase family)